MTLTLISHNADETQAIGARLAELLQPNDVLLLSGDLGAGKTEFTQGVAKGLGIEEPVNSPTFNLLLTHPLPAATTDMPHALYHFDLYRLDDSEQLTDIDYFGMLEDGAVALVEWGDRFSDALPVDYLLIEIAILSENLRQLTFSAVGEQSLARLRTWHDNHDR